MFAPKVATSKDDRAQHEAAASFCLRSLRLCLPTKPILSQHEHAFFASVLCCGVEGAAGGRRFEPMTS